MRVQLNSKALVYIGSRIIPACAGTTDDNTLKLDSVWDHPRVCGYNCIYSCCLPRCRGSSPRVRVQLCNTHLTTKHQGIIPACAGTTSSRFIFYREIWDHPRVCGYNGKDVQFKASATGSSPRVRVQQWIEEVNDGHSRIIPACAGTTTRHSQF